MMATSLLGNDTNTNSTNNSSKKNHLLVVCDCQPDALNGMIPQEKDALLTAVGLALQAARHCNTIHIVFTGLKFPADYKGVSPEHHLFGALQRLHAKVGAQYAHWFLDGWPGAEIEPSLLLQTKDQQNANNETVLWRTSHLPSPELLELVQAKSITEATVIGVKAAYTVQATVQALCAFTKVYTINECIADDTPERCAAVSTLLFGIYATAQMSLAQWVDQVCYVGGFDSFCDLTAAITSNNTDDDNDKTAAHYLADCGRGGHFQLYAVHLLQRPGWRRYPLQPWYNTTNTNSNNTTNSRREFKCPLGKRVLDFCDEPGFSRTTTMYVLGREWLDEKSKVWQLARDCMPETYCFNQDEGWLNDMQPNNNNAAANQQAAGPWFIKECDKNGGRAIQLCRDADECEDLMVETIGRSSFVVQAHIRDPLLTVDGKKCHLKMYCLLQCGQDGVSWTLHTYQECFLSVSRNLWAADSLDTETQVTIRRSERLRPGTEPEVWMGWPSAYAKCKATVATVVERACAQGKLLGRPGKKQFEICSADLMLDTFGKAWLIEFNFGPVLFDPKAGQELTTPGLKQYQQLYERQGAEAEVNDRVMIGDAVSMVFFPDENRFTPSLWGPAGEFQGQLPVPTVPSEKKDGGLPGLFSSMVM